MFYHEDNRNSIHKKIVSRFKEKRKLMRMFIVLINILMFMILFISIEIQNMLID